MSFPINPEAVRRLHTGPHLDPSQAEDPLDLGEVKPAPSIEPPATSAALCRVISVRGRKHAELLADPSFVYVGRSCAGWPKSAWGNPFKVGLWARENIRKVCREHPINPEGYDRIWALEPVNRLKAYLTAEEAVALYAEFVRGHRDLPAMIPSLRGKTLGCWCGDWAPGRPEILCHAVVLAKLANALEVRS